MKLKLLIIFSICVSMLYAEDNNTYVKQQVAYKDQGASGKEFVEMHGLDEYDKSRLFNAT